MNRFIDYSQWNRFSKCEWDWYEHYIKQLGRKPKEGERDDVLTLGTLVHAGLESYRSIGRPEIQAEVIDKANPTHDCYEQAQHLLNGYVQRYPTEDFKISKTEAPIRFSLLPEIDGLAKVDNYFHCASATRMESGLGFGEAALPPDFMLTPGWWIREYKTKDAARDRGNYITSWRMNMQVNFQMLALAELVGEMPQGILVDIIEKPKPYVPKHTCKACKKQSSRSDWTPTGAGYLCPACNNLQELDISNKQKVERIPSYYRLMVTRTPQVLTKAKCEIANAGMRMLDLINGSTPIRSTERCVDSIFGQCEYFKAHAEDVGAWMMPSEYVQIDALSYIGEKLEPNPSD